MAIFEHERKNGIQLGTVGDTCMECRYKHRHDEEYDPVRLDYQPVYKVWVNNLPHCMCLDCFKESLGKYILVDPDEIVEEKPIPKAAKKAIANATKKKEEKKEDDKDGSETA